MLAGFYEDDSSPILNWLSNANFQVIVDCIERSGARTPHSTIVELHKQSLKILTQLLIEKNILLRSAELSSLLGAIKGLAKHVDTLSFDDDDYLHEFTSQFRSTNGKEEYPYVASIGDSDTSRLIKLLFERNYSNIHVFDAGTVAVFNLMTLCLTPKFLLIAGNMSLPGYKTGIEVLQEWQYLAGGTAPKALILSATLHLSEQIQAASLDKVKHVATPFDIKYLMAEIDKMLLS